MTTVTLMTVVPIAVPQTAEAQTAAAQTAAAPIAAAQTVAPTADPAMIPQIAETAKMWAGQTKCCK